MNVQNLTAFGQYLSNAPTALPRPPSMFFGWLTSPSASPADPFAEEGDPLNASNEVGSQQNYIHVRVQQRNGRKTLTTLQGLPKGEYKLAPWGR